MLRAGVTQTRSFGWTGSDLTSAANPENGTVNYTYDNAHHVLTRTDAKGQQTQYTYDIYGRLTLTKHLVGGTEDLTQRVTYYYDSLSPQPPFYLLPSGCCSNLAGRLAAVQFPNSNSAVNNANNGTNVKQLLYVYSYNQAGRVTMQDLRLLSGTGYTPTADYYATYTWDNMGRMTALNYPVSGPQTAMAYDAMSNLSAATESICQTYDQNGNCLTWGSPLALASAAYNFAGQLTTFNFNNFSITGPYPSPWFQTETHSYNSMLQLTNITTTTTNPSGGQVNMTYTYSATQNNGRIVSSSDGVTGENVSYTYDSLNRLIAAATTGRGIVQWSYSYTYDGFGNLTSKVSGQGNVYPQVDSTTNRARMINDYGFDANGNWLGTPGPPALVNTCNVENQLISNGAQDGQNRLYTYTYDPWGKRALQYATGGSYGPTGTFYFYSITGQRLGTYSLQHLVATQVSVNMFFGGRMLVAMDRLGSVRNKGGANIAYFPWGEERTSTTDGSDKFATYFRDGQFQDYASARYYNNSFGRFWSVDPGGVKAVNPKDPTSWNRYTYVNGDPVNHTDRRGLFLSAEDCISNPDACGDEDWGNGGGGDVGGGGGGGGAPCNNPTASSFMSTGEEESSCEGDDPPPVQQSPTCSDWSCMPAAFARAVEALTLNSQCMDLFGTATTRAGKFDPVTVLTNIVFGPNTLGHIQFADEGPNWGVAETVPSGHFPIPGLAGSVSITINEYTDPAGSLYWNAGNAAANAETLCMSSATHSTSLGAPVGSQYRTCLSLEIPVHLTT